MEFQKASTVSLQPRTNMCLWVAICLRLLQAELFLPKSSDVDNNGRIIRSLEALRPLTLCNFGCKILTTAICRGLQWYTMRCIHSSQRCISSRQMTDNIFEIETTALAHVACAPRESSILQTDSSAAYPCVTKAELFLFPSPLTSTTMERSSDRWRLYVRGRCVIAIARFSLRRVHPSQRCISSRQRTDNIVELMPRHMLRALHVNQDDNSWRDHMFRNLAWLGPILNQFSRMNVLHARKLHWFGVLYRKSLVVIFTIFLTKGFWDAHASGFRSDVVHLQLNTKVRAKTLKTSTPKFGHLHFRLTISFFATADFQRNLQKCFPSSQVTLLWSTVWRWWLKIAIFMNFRKKTMEM